MLQLNISNNKLQDILEDLNLLDENHMCTCTVEEVLKAGIGYGVANYKQLVASEKIKEEYKSLWEKIKNLRRNYPKIISELETELILQDEFPITLLSASQVHTAKCIAKESFMDCITYLRKTIPGATLKTAKTYYDLYIK